MSRSWSSLPRSALWWPARGHTGRLQSGSLTCPPSPPSASASMPSAARPRRWSADCCRHWTPTLTRYSRDEEPADEADEEVGVERAAVRVEAEHLDPGAGVPEPDLAVPIGLYRHRADLDVPEPQLAVHCGVDGVGTGTDPVDAQGSAVADIPGVALGAAVHGQAQVPGEHVGVQAREAVGVAVAGQLPNDVAGTHERHGELRVDRRPGRGEAVDLDEDLRLERPYRLRDTAPLRPGAVRGRLGVDEPEPVGVAHRVLAVRGYPVGGEAVDEDLHDAGREGVPRPAHHLAVAARRPVRGDDHRAVRAAETGQVDGVLPGPLTRRGVGTAGRVVLVRGARGVAARGRVVGPDVCAADDGGVGGWDGQPGHRRRGQHDRTRQYGDSYPSACYHGSSSLGHQDRRSGGRASPTTSMTANALTVNLLVSVCDRGVRPRGLTTGPASRPR